MLERSASQPLVPETQAGSAFAENRKRIGYFFETKQLRNLLKEFYDVQQTFHLKMHNLVMAFGDQSGHLSEDQQQLLEKLLYPYGILVANPFAPEPTGDIEKDVQHILSVVNVRNEHFSKMLTAMMVAAANLPDFNLFLAELKKNAEVKSGLMVGVNANGWGNIEGDISLPFQNLMRYRLLLDQIRKELVNAGCKSVEPVLMNIMDAIAYIMPELKYINQHRDTLRYLNDIDAMLVVLSGMQSLQGCVTEADRASGFTFQDKVECVRVFIDGSILDIANGRGDVVEILKGLKVALETLQEGLTESLAKERATYYSLGYHLLAGASERWLGVYNFFPKIEKDPREKLADTINELDIQIKHLVAAREAYQWLTSKDPAIDIPVDDDLRPAFSLRSTLTKTNSNN